MAQTVRNESTQRARVLSEQQQPMQIQPQPQQTSPDQRINQNQHRMPKAPETIGFIEVFEALKQGKMPNNDQLFEMFNRLLNIRAIEERQHLMSPDGQKLLADFRSLITTLQKVLYCKNEDQLLQSLHYHLHNLNLQPIERLQNMNGEQQITSEQVKKEAKRGARALLKIGKLIITNGHFREQLSELTAISEEVFSDTASELADISNQLNDIIQDDLSQLEMMGGKGSQHQLSVKLSNETSRCSSTRSKCGSTPEPIIDNLPVDQEQQQSDVGNTEEEKDDMQTQLDSEKEEWRQLLNEQTERLKKAEQYAREKFSAEKVGELVERLKMVVAEIQANPGYQDAINTLLWLFETWSHRTENIVEYSGGIISQTVEEHQSLNWTAAGAEIKAIVEDWAQGRSLDPLIRGVDAIIEDIKNNSELSQCYEQSARYLRRLLQEKGYVIHGQSTEDGKYLVNHIRELTTGRYRDHVDFLVNEAKAYLRTMEDDPMARELEMQFKQIHNDLWLDANGNTAFKPQLLTDMRMVLPPTILELIKSLPIPKIEYSDKQVDLALANIVLPGDTLLPGNLEIKMDNYIQFSPHTNVTSVNQQFILIKTTDIRTTIKDVVWFYKRKVSFPKLSDRGVATVVIGGKKGVSVTAKIVSDSKNKIHTFTVAQCKCRVDNIKVKIKGSRHDILYRTIKPLMVSVLKRHIEKAVEEKIIELVEQVDSKLTTSITKQYMETMARETIIQTFGTPLNYQQGTTIMPITSTGGTNEPSTVMELQERPGLFVALLTIMNRSIRSLMLSGIHDQQAKKRKKKMEKRQTPQNQQLYNKENTVQDIKQQEEQLPSITTSNIGTGFSRKLNMGNISPFKTTEKMLAEKAPSSSFMIKSNTSLNTSLHTDNKNNMVSVIIGTDGNTYIEKNDQLVPVHIVGGLGANHTPKNDQRDKMQNNHIMKKNNFSSNKHYRGTENLQHQYQHYHGTISPNK